MKKNYFFYFPALIILLMTAFAFLLNELISSSWIIDVKKIVLFEEYLDSFMYDLLYDRPPKKPYILFLGASSGYYGFPKNYVRNWKFNRADNMSKLEEHYLGAFTGMEYPTFYFPILELLDQQKKILEKNNILVLTLTDVPFKDEDINNTFETFFNKWHNRCQLFKWQNEKIIIERPITFLIENKICNLKRFSSQIRSGLIHYQLEQLYNLFGIKKGHASEENFRQEYKDSLLKEYGDRKIESYSVNSLFDKTFKKNIESLLKKNIRIIFLMMPQGSVRRQLFPGARLAHDYYKKYALEMNIPLLDYYESLSDDKFLPRDYIHLNETGAKLLSSDVFIKLNISLEKTLQAK